MKFMVAFELIKYFTLEAGRGKSIMNGMTLEWNEWLIAGSLPPTNELNEQINGIKWIYLWMKRTAGWPAQRSKSINHQFSINSRRWVNWWNWLIYWWAEQQLNSNSLFQTHQQIKKVWFLIEWKRSWVDKRELK